MCFLNAWGYDILVFAASFQKSNIGWPQQPRTEKISDTSKKLDFWWSIQQKTLVLVILVPGMIQPSGSGSSWMKWGCWGHWGHRGCWGCWGHWGCRGSRAWKITTEGFRLIQVLDLSFISMFLGKKFLGGIMKYQVGFKHVFCLRLLRSAYVTFLKTGCKYQNVITSGI